MFDYWSPDEISTWIRVVPQSYSYQIFDREAYKVVDVTEGWYEHSTHFIGGIKRSFNCSSGPGNDRPCYGHAIRNAWYDEKRAKEAEGKQMDSQYPPLSEYKQYSFAITVVEPVISIPLMTKDGKIRRNKKGEVIYTFVPKSSADEMQLKNVKEELEGYNYHWSMGQQHFQQLLDLDLALQSKDTKTGDDLHCIGIACNDCYEMIYDFASPCEGDDIVVWRTKDIECPSCHYTGPQMPVLVHPDNQEFEAGSLMEFDIRIKAVPVGNNKSVLKVVGARVPEYGPELIKLVNNPLDLPGIYAPTDLKHQERLLGDLAKGVNPHPNPKSLAQGYDTKSEGEVNYDE